MKTGKLKWIAAMIMIGCSILKSQTEKELNCFEKWNERIEERGVAEIADGEYPDVIITYRTGANADCFQGKAIVKGKKIEAFYLLLEDGSYDQVIKKWKPESDVKNVTITNGISRALVTTDNVIINVIFAKQIKGKKAAPKKAEDPEN